MMTIVVAFNMFLPFEFYQMGHLVITFLTPTKKTIMVHEEKGSFYTNVVRFP